MSLVNGETKYCSGLNGSQREWRLFILLFLASPFGTAGRVKRFHWAVYVRLCRRGQRNRSDRSTFCKSKKAHRMPNGWRGGKETLLERKLSGMTGLTILLHLLCNQMTIKKGEEEEDEPTNTLNWSGSERREQRATKWCHNSLNMYSPSKNVFFHRQIMLDRV